MRTDVIVTGTGNPIISPGRAGPGVLVRHGTTLLQFDAGLATALRLVEAGVALSELSALFVTHHHTDHCTGIPEVVVGRFLQNPAARPPALPTIAPIGVATDYLEHMLDPLQGDLGERRRHIPDLHFPGIQLVPFDGTLGHLPCTVWSAGGIEVTAFGVHHGDVAPAVGYRVRTPAGTVVISGDTVVCDEVETMAAGADVLVHEVISTTVADRLQPGFPPMRFIRSIHAESIALGAMAQRCGVRTLVLTHLVPPPHPDDAEGCAVFANDVRAGGFTGQVVVARDLETISVDPTDG